jgi:hypothetical protein
MAMAGNTILVAAAALGLTTAVAAAAPRHLDTIERECGRRLHLPGPGCTCLRERAAKLKDGQQAFVAAVVVKDKAAQARLRQGMTVQELTEAGMFMTNAPGQCARR